MSGSPEDLLRSALEKIVFFECRVANLENEVDAARVTAARAREEAGAARRRETELETSLAQARGEQATATVRAAELAERVRLLEAERERFLSGLVERARVAGAPAGEGDDAGSEADLAGFISELRAEIEQLRAWKALAEGAGLRLEPPGGGPIPTPVPRAERAPVAAVPALAQRFHEAGRMEVTREQARAIPTFSTRSERALYEASLDDLSAADPGRRRRAADGLKALGSRNAAPLLAAAVGREGDPEVKAALLAALGALAEPGAADLALRELADPRPTVRAAALEAANALDRDRVVPQLAAALADPSPLVRRRAVVLLGFTPGEAAEDALAGALSDREAGVARAAAVALSGRPSARAQGALAHALEHPEPEVRRAAARATARWSGEAVDTAAPEPERRRAARRIAEKLLAVDGAELRSAVTRVSVPVAAAAPAPSPRPSPPAGERVKQAPRSTSRPRVAGAGRGEGLLAAASPAATLQAAAAVADPALAAAAEAEVRTALRGRTAEELAATLAQDRLAVEAALRSLVAQGRLVARGPRFFMS